MKAVILAGGRGTRLKPYTNVFPKPLMPIGEKPILEIIINQLVAHGIEDIIITVGHMSALIMNFFGDGGQVGAKIRYFKEEKPLGTSGNLGSLKEELTDTFVVINGDTLTTLNYSQMIDEHIRNGSVATVALKRREVYIDFGTVEIDDANSIREYIEKPTLSYLVSIGVNIFNPRVLNYIKAGERLDFPDLVRTLISSGETVKGFIFDGYWLDIGRPADYDKANEEIEQIKGQLGL
jgi:NDP-sugar pyrophosphorylase family protein